MNILVINPNTSQSMTDEIETTLSNQIVDGDTISVIKSDIGPESLESFYDYSLATVGMLEKLSSLDLNDYDGILVACYGDPGLYALKESLSIPIIGIAESSIATASLIADNFSILTASKKAIPMMANMIRQYGHESKLTSIHALELSVLEVDSTKNQLMSKFKNAIEQCINDGAESIILGCAGMTGTSYTLQNELEIPVIDPVVSGYHNLRSIILAKLFVSGKGLFKTPHPQKITGFQKISI